MSQLTDTEKTFCTLLRAIHYSLCASSLKCQLPNATSDPDWRKSSYILLLLLRYISRNLGIAAETLQTIYEKILDLLAVKTSPYWHLERTHRRVSLSSSGVKEFLFIRIYAYAPSAICNTYNNSTHITTVY